MRTHIYALATLVVLAGGGAAATTLLSVDDGNFFYDQNGDCIGDSDTSRTAVALHHWHYGAPFAGVSEEIQGGFGCAGGPRTWTIVVPPGETATLEGRFRYTWDIHVFPGGGNDIHLLVRDAAGTPVYSTLATQGPLPAVGSPSPAVPSPIGALTRAFATTLSEGTYTITEDVTSGAHTAYLTRIAVTIG